MRVAVIGSGISGLGAALALTGNADVRLFERDSRFGGHANTVTVNGPAGRVAVDTGFIVYNTGNYPNLTALFEHLGVPTHWSDMSFGFSLARGRLEYACDSLDSLFAQRRNALNPAFLAGLRDILRFNRTAAAEMDSGALDGLSLGQWLAERRYSGWFRDRFLAPMGGAIWSMPASAMMDFPARNFVSFFRNHDLMTGLAPARRWRTVTGGSREYVRRILLALGPRARAGLAATAIRRQGGKPLLSLSDGSEAIFDHVIVATHAPDALALLSDAGAEERDVLSAFRTTANRAVLHSDPALMPARRKVWSSWNFLTDGDGSRPASVTYWMNRLQGLPADLPLFVSLNPDREPDPARIWAAFDYAHPLYNAAAFAGQTRLDSIQGRGGVWFAGAWTGYGFHEDGLRSALRVAAALGIRPAWARDSGDPMRGGFARAAE